MDKKEIVKWARQCANTVCKCEGCPFDGKDQFCRDFLLNTLAEELENSISKADFDQVLKAFQMSGKEGLTYEQTFIYESLFKGNLKRINRDKMLANHDEYYMFYNGKLLKAKDLIHTFEKETGYVVSEFSAVKAYFDKQILATIPKANMTYEMLLRNGYKIEAIRLYREYNNCSLSEANAAITEIKASLT